MTTARVTTAATQPATHRDAWERERLLESLEAYRRGVADAPTLHKFGVAGLAKAAPDGPLTFVASDESEDRMGDVVRAGGWDLDQYKRNPVFLWAHDYSRTPVGRSVWIGVESARLLSTVVFAPTDFAREVEALYRGQFLRAVSVGFRAKAFSFRKAGDGKVEGVEFTQQELLEVSAVAVPANPHALARALEGGLRLPLMQPLLTLPRLPAGSGTLTGRERHGDVGDEDAASVIAAMRRLRATLAG